MYKKCIKKFYHNVKKYYKALFDKYLYLCRKTQIIV